MTVATENSRVDYTGNGVTTVFPFTFEIPQQSQAVVTKHDDDGTVTTLVADSDFTITGLATPAGGSITYPISGAALPSTSRLSIKRVLDMTQGIDLRNAGRTFPETFETALDEAVMRDQQLAEVQGRTMRLEETPESETALTMPAPVAGEVLAWNADATALVGVSVVEGEVAQELRISNAEAAIIANKADSDAGIAANAAGLVSGMGLLSISGLVPSNAADADHDITISTGSAVDSSGTKILSLSTAITKQIDAAWTAGDNAGGLFSGTVAADTTYHLFIIEKDSDSSIDAGFDTSLTAANIPAGYTKYRRTASFLTDGSANIIAFIANECSGGALCINYVDRITDVSTSSPGSGTTIYASSTPYPTESAIKINMSVHLDSTGFSTQAICVGSPLLDLAQFGMEADIWHQPSGLISSVNLEVMTSESGSIAFYSSDTNVSSFEINTIGFTDYRI